MALFRRQQTTEIPELKEYYEAQKSDNPAKAWILALVSLLLTIGVVLGLFFGGRWLYRTLFDEDEPASSTTSETQTPGDSDESTGVGQQEEQPAQPEQEDEPESQPETATPQTPSTPTPPAATAPAQTDNTEEQPAPSPAPTPAPTTTPTTGALPSTGPGDVVAIFVVTVLLGYLAHNRFTSRQDR